MKRDDDEGGQVHCPGCGAAVTAGQHVVHVEDDDPWRSLWHRSCHDRLTAAAAVPSDVQVSGLETRARELARRIEATFSGTAAELELFPSGAVMLDVRWSGRLFVLAYYPSNGWFGVDEVLADDGIGDHYRFAAQTFDEAAGELLRLVQDAHRGAS